MRTLDIILDKAGYYICWGCLVFVPGFYASPTLYLVHNAKEVTVDVPVVVVLLDAYSLTVTRTCPVFSREPQPSVRICGQNLLV